MSQLAKLLGGAGSIDRIIVALEANNNHAAIDARLVGDVHEAMAKALKSLQLDPANTSGPELYRTLGNRFADDFGKLVKNQKFNEESLKALFSSKDFPKFWKDNLMTGAVYDGAPMSLNVFDVFADFRLNAPYARRESSHFRQTLAEELLKRYEKHFGANYPLIDKLKHVTIEQVNNPKRKK
ncbi:hypothetical protein FACS189431_8360 [Alphaproteobacteria bacterium]|nr:hypothetical protein FACS189431_8360 [Alphaproteobacteria bacterium]